ncbi:hypothetical protein Tco_1308205, partial [Tanacetum coccineum]
VLAVGSSDAGGGQKRRSCCRWITPVTATASGDGGRRQKRMVGEFKHSAFPRLSTVSEGLEEELAPEEEIEGVEGPGK